MLGLGSVAVRVFVFVVLRQLWAFAVDGFPLDVAIIGNVIKAYRDSLRDA